MRLFLGSFAKIENLKSIKRDFKDCIDANWVKEKNIHLTYLFLGEVEKPNEIVEKLDNIFYEKKSLNIRSLGLFFPKILYAKINDKRVFKLHQEICKRLDIKPDKPFVPHITLARIKKIKIRQKLFDKINFYKDKKVGVMNLDLALIKSTLTSNGAKYEIIKEF